MGRQLKVLVYGETRLRFVERIDALGDCWEWLGGKRGGGYGRFKLKGRDEQAHRISYEMFVGPIPTGLELDHPCRNRACVNPDHLEPVTRRENHLRGLGRFNKQGQTHCKRGHSLDDAYRGAQGQRNCRTCALARAAAQRAAA